MTRSRSALAAAVAALALLAGCSGGDASQSDVQDKVADLLTEDGYLGQELSATEAAAASACVAQTLFDPGEFTKDERNEVSSAVDSEQPPSDLSDRFVAVVDGCVEDATQGEPAGPNVDDENDDEETTTTEDQVDDVGDDTTTTTGDG